MLLKRKPQQPTTGQSAQGPPENHQAVLQDELGLCHLWYFELRLEQELVRAARSGSPFSLIIWQLRLLPGESLADELLRRVASFLVKSLRSYDIAARLDDQRFVALLYDALPEAACTVAYRIKGDLQLRVPSAGRWQAGVATFGRDAVDGDALIMAALRRLEGAALAA